MIYTLVKIKRKNYYRISWAADTINGSHDFGYEFEIPVLHEYLTRFKK